MIINRPEKRNAQHPANGNVLGDVKGDPTVQILVISEQAEEASSAGSDLKELSTFSPPGDGTIHGPLLHSSFTRDLSN